MNKDKGIKKRAAAERRKLRKLLVAAGATEDRLKILDPIIDNASWMKVKLDDARELVEEESLTVEYDNGGGQHGIRENPMFKGYGALWKSYTAAMNMILTSIPQAKQAIRQDEPAKPQSMLELIRSKKSKEA